jgi:enediyne biosynthesis protein E4
VSERPSRRAFFQWLGRYGVLAPLPSLIERLFAAVSPPATPKFTDITGRSGLRRAKNTSGAPIDKHYLLEEMGCGVALFDFDNDGWLDIFLVNGSTFDETAPRPGPYLLRNNRDGTFTDVTRKSGIRFSGWGQGCCVGDFDNDGFDDLFVSGWGRNALYRNNGDGTFDDVSAKAGVTGTTGRWGAGCCFLDYDRNGLLDLFVAHYVALDLTRVPKPGESDYCRYNHIPVPCGPQGLTGGSNVLYRNRGDGTFEDVSEKSGIARPAGQPSFNFDAQNWQPKGSYGMGAACADFDNDGWPDIYVACDTAPSLLYRNNHDGTFREIAVPAGAAFDENGTALSGMGVGVADYDRDGWFDIVRTNFSDQITVLYRNNGDGSFYDASMGAGLGVNRKYVGFGTGFFDFDNDGWKDIFIANGHVYAQLATNRLHVSYREPRLLYRNLRNGRFEDVSAKAGPPVTTPDTGRGCAFGDLDNDGDVDIVINNLDGPPAVLRNDTAGNNSLLIKCIGTKSNRTAIGTRVKLTTGDQVQMDEVMSGSSYYSQNDLRLHFGLRDAVKADRIEVAWPSGANETFENVPANHLVVLREGQGIVKTERLRSSR